MTWMQIIFLLAAAILLGSALMVVTSRKMLHAALWLVLALFGVAVVFALLQAGFFAVVQVVIYIGAIAILVIFAVMLTRQVMDDQTPQASAIWPLAALSVAVGFTVLTVIFLRWEPFQMGIPALADASQTPLLLGKALVSPEAYVLPFEVASVLLLAAMIGAIYLARERPHGLPTETSEGGQA